MKRRILRHCARLLLFLLRHAPLVISALILTLAAHLVLKNQARITFLDRVLSQPLGMISMPGRTVTIDDALVMFLPECFTEIPRTPSPAADGSCIAAYRCRDLLGRTMTLRIIRAEGYSVGEDRQTDPLSFSCWFSADRAHYLFLIRAENSFCTASVPLCRSLHVLLRSVRIIFPE